MKLAKTPTPPYYAVIFSSLRKPDDNGYQAEAEKMGQLCRNSAGFLGMDSAHSEIGITVCYWDSLESIENWKNNTDHIMAQKSGKEIWYQAYELRIAKVERAYGFSCKQD